MASPGEQVVPWKPRGVCDTIIGAAVQEGAMSSLQNLIHDPGTPNAFVCRPANTLEIDFTTWAAAVPAGNAGAITAAGQVGNIVYGLVSILTGTFAGHDYPFAYDHDTAAFLTVTGTITTGTTPTSQATTGAWVPPQMALTGVDYVVTHTGFAGGGNSRLNRGQLRRGARRACRQPPVRRTRTTDCRGGASRRQGGNHQGRNANRASGSARAACGVTNAPGAFAQTKCGEAVSPVSSMSEPGRGMLIRLDVAPAPFQKAVSDPD